MVLHRRLREGPDTSRRAWAHVHDPPPRLPTHEVPPGLQDVLDRALAKEPQDRQQSAAKLAEGLAEACDR